ncbi:MAG: hypothetical protein ACRC8J_09150 [Phocaeicola sp.]
MNIEMIKMLGSGTTWLANLPINLLTLPTKNKGSVAQTEIAWEKEKVDILERAEWLETKIIKDPKKLLSEVPSLLGSLYGGQWALYGCSMYLSALANICKLYPEEKERSIARMEKLIDLVLTPEIRSFDSKDWNEDPLQGLPGKKGHLTYYSSLGWMISLYKLSGGTLTTYDDIFHRCCEGINRRMLSAKDMGVASSSNGIVFISDMVCACVVLHNYAKLYDGTYEDTVMKWMKMAKTDMIHKPSGLLIAEKRYKLGKRVKGSYTALTNYYLTQLDDKQFANDQYERMKKTFRKDKPFTGIKEYQRDNSTLRFDPNAGPIYHGISGSGTAISIGAATYFGDGEFRSRLLQTAEIGGQTIQKKGSRHYRLSEVAFVGEAMVLAMRTHIEK